MFLSCNTDIYLLRTKVLVQEHCTDTLLSIAEASAVFVAVARDGIFIIPAATNLCFRAMNGGFIDNMIIVLRILENSTT